MRLQNILSMMVEEYPDRHIQLRGYTEGRGKLGGLFYKGSASELLNYIKIHDNLNQWDGFPVQVQNIHNWNVVEILVDRSIPEEKDLPDYNKGKIIIIH